MWGMAFTIRNTALLLLLATATGLSETVLRMEKVGSSEASVVFVNDSEVAALQFTLSGEGLTLGGVRQGVRMSSPQWQMSVYAVDGSTINVVIIRSGVQALPAGEGVIATVSVSGTSGIVNLDRVVVADPSAQGIPVTVAGLEWNATDDAVALGQNYPNPFNPATTIPYTIDRTNPVRLMIYDIAGREVKRVVDGMKSAGSYSAVWDGTDERGLQVPSGVYLARVEAGTTVKTKKMILAR